MPITINGSGTITGITAGGLPDAIITQPDLATGVAGTGPAFSCRSSTTQSIGNSTFTKITLNVVDFDTNSNFSSSRFTPTVSGYYQINAMVGFAGSTVGYAQTAIYKNGTVYRQGSGCPNNTNTGGATNVSDVVYLNGTTDYVEMYAWQNSGGALSTIASVNTTTYFSGALVRAA